MYVASARVPTEQGGSWKSSMESNFLEVLREAQEARAVPALLEPEGAALGRWGFLSS